jgi:hypothetical protein
MHRFATLVLTLLCLASCARKTVVLEPGGIVCREPECDIQRSISHNVDLPNERQDIYIERVKAVRASVLDSTLKPVRFETWLMAGLQQHRAPLRAGESFAFWELSICDNLSGAFPIVSPDMCVEVSIPLVEDRQLHVKVLVAEETPQDPTQRWRDIVPRVHDIYIERVTDSRSIDSLDVRSLSSITQYLGLPFDKWPAVDLRTSVRSTPTNPSPGQDVRFIVAVANAGGRDAERAHVTIYISMPLNNTDLSEIRREWFPSIRAGQSVELDIPTRLGRGDAVVMVQAAAHGSKHVREVNTKDNDTVAEIRFVVRVE